MRVIPVINEIEIDEVQKKIELIKDIFDWVQIDISDGIFTSRKTNFGPIEIEKIKADLNLEIHLMISEPEKSIEKWLNIPNVKRVIIHLEEIEKDFPLPRDKEIGLAISPSTEWEKIEQYLNKTNFFLFLGVNPGPSGQKFQSTVLENIKKLRRNKPEAIIGVDGGVNLDTIEQIKSAGTDIAYSTSYLFNSPDIKKALAKLSSNF
jgi:ribulose-phosphate 3-epimerase